MAIEGIGAVFNDGSSDIGEVVDIVIPDDEVKEYETTTLSDTREQFKMSAMSVGQECTLVIRLNPEVPPIAARTALTAAVITLSKQDPTSTVQASYTFDCFVKSLSGGSAQTSSTEGITQNVLMRLTSEVTPVNES